MSNTYDPTQAYDPTAGNHSVEESSQGRASSFISLVYKDKSPMLGLPIRPRNFAKEGATTLLIQPVYGPDWATNPHSWWPYRHPKQPVGNGLFRFTPWIRAIWYHPFLAGKANIISPRTFRPGDQIIPNVVQQLFDTAKRLPEFMALAGFDPATGKKPKDRGKDDWKKVIIKEETQFWIVNAVNQGAENEEERQISCLYEIPHIAWAGSGKPDEQGWGLMAKLNMKKLDFVPQDPNDMDAPFYNGDITSIALGYRPVVFRKKDPPTKGSVKIWDADITGTRIPWIPKALETRQMVGHPDDIFVEKSQAEILDVVMSLFAGHEKLLRAAFENTVPQFGDKFLKVINAISGPGTNRVNQAGVDHSQDGDYIPGTQGDPNYSAPTPPPASTQSQFAPPTNAFTQAPPPPPGAAAPAQSAPPAPPVEYWVIEGGQTVSKTDTELKAAIAAGAPLTTQIVKKGESTWKTAAEYGFTAPAPQTQAAPPPPPATQAAPPPPAAPAASAPAPVVPQPTAPPSTVPQPTAPQQVAAATESSTPAATGDAGVAPTTTSPSDIAARAAMLAAQVSGGAAAAGSGAGAPPPPPASAM